jgi:hypothetical protein
MIKQNMYLDAAYLNFISPPTIFVSLSSVV